MALPSCATRPRAPALEPQSARSFQRSGQRGVGTGLLRFGERRQADLDALLEIGAIHVRMFFELEVAPSGNSFVWPEAQIASLVRNAAELQARGLYRVPTVFAPVKETDATWSSAALQASLVEFWGELTRQLLGTAVYAAFDLVNEPVPPRFNCGRRQQRWLGLASRLVDAVQAADPTRVYIVESAPNSIPSSFDNLRPLSQPNLVCSIHLYMPIAFTHQRVVAEHPTPLRYTDVLPGGETAATELTESVAAAIAFSRRYGLPVYVREFRASPWAPEHSAAVCVADSIAHFERHGLSWAHHEFRAWHGWDAEMAPTSRDAGNRSSEAPVRRVLEAGFRRHPAGG